MGSTPTSDISFNGSRTGEAPSCYLGSCGFESYPLSAIHLQNLTQMKKHQQPNPSRRDIQRLVSSGDVIIVTDDLIVLLLFWFEKDGDHCFSYLRSKEVKILGDSLPSSSVHIALWYQIKDWCYDWSMSLSAEIIHVED